MPAVDYSTPATITVTANGKEIFKEELLGSPDYFQEPADCADAAFSARVLNPDLPADTAIEITLSTRYGQTPRRTKLGTIRPNHVYRLPEVHRRFLGKHPGADPAIAAKYRPASYL